MQGRLSGIAGALGRQRLQPHVGPGGGATGLVDRTVQAQATVMAYNNAFILLGITFLIAMPAVLLLRRPKRTAAPPAEAH